VAEAAAAGAICGSAGTVSGAPSPWFMPMPFIADGHADADDQRRSFTIQSHSHSLIPHEKTGACGAASIFEIFQTINSKLSSRALFGFFSNN